jgi:hypothetical protein
MNATAPRTSTPAILSLIFGILSWCMLPFLGAIIAVVCGHTARGEIRRAAPGTIEGDGLALAGLILGYLQLLLTAVFAIGIILVLVGVVSYHH